MVLAAAGSASAQTYYQAYSAPVYYENGYQHYQAPQYMNNSDVQSRLINLGYYVGPHGVNGVMTEHTVAAIRYFQSSHGIKVDGVVGAETRAALSQYDYSQNPAYRSHYTYGNSQYRNGYASRYRPVNQVYYTTR